MAPGKCFLRWPTFALLAVTLLCGCGAASRPRRLFSPSSVWNAPLADNAPLDTRSQQLVGWLLGIVTHEFAQGPAPYIQTTTYSTPIYRVPATQATVRVILDNQAPWARTLARALQAVPIPPTAMPAAGSDAHMTIWQPSTDRLWELWQARHAADGWHAAWGGAMEHVSRSPGYFTRESWPGAEPYWGATATSLPVAAGTMRIDELRFGRIDHALAVALPSVKAGEYSWPAQRTDGTDTDPNAIPEGARLRLDPHLNIPGLHLPPLMQEMALAAQRYGLIVRDKTGQSIGFYAEDPGPGGGNPYPSIFRGIPPYDLLKSFPWSHLELLRMDLRRGTGSPP